MKKIVILLFVTVISLYSQDKEPSAWKFVWGFSNTPRVFEPDSFKQTSFMSGFQWSGSPQMNIALRNNACANQTYTRYPGFNYEKPMNYVLQPTWRINNGWHIGTFRSIFMQYEPTLLISPTDRGRLITRKGDPSDPIFGFSTVNGYRYSESDSNNENYSRLILTKGMTLPADNIVLKGISEYPNFHTHFSFEGGQTDDYLGKRWFVTINLRRLYPDSSTEVLDDSTVLSIKLPYSHSKGGSNINMKFRFLPTNNVTDTNNIEHMNYFEDRGIALKMNSIRVFGVDSIRITRRMLPKGGDYKNITIVAEFVTNNDDAKGYNPAFREYDTSKAHITNFDIVVKYFKTADVAVDYIRVGNEYSYHLLKGEVDSIEPWSWTDVNGRGSLGYDSDPDCPGIGGSNDIKNVIQSTLNLFKERSDNYQNDRIFRFYFQDIECPQPYWWGAIRYANKLSNNMFMTRDIQYFPALYEYYTKCQNRWIGTGYSSNPQPFSHIAAPYLRIGYQSESTMNIRGGFYGHAGLEYPDSLNSQYESSIQDRWEKNLRFNFTSIDTSDNNSAYNTYNCKFLYTKEPWWGWVLINNLGVNGNDNLVFGYYRPYTGEEYRQTLMSSIIMGCKGFVVDGDQNQTLPNTCQGSVGLGNDSIIGVGHDLYSDDVGTDFIDTVHSTWGAYMFAKLDTLSKYMIIPKTRIYIGTKSVRTEIKRIQDWIRRNDTTLIKLQLCTWYGKGYRVFTHYDSSTFFSNVLNKYINIDTNHLYTTKVWDPTLKAPPTSKEDWAKSFFDITILRDKNIPIISDSNVINLGKVFYIGVQNRRTDPLVRPIDSLYCVNINPTGGSYTVRDSSMKFYSTAEYDINCDQGGHIIVPNPSTSFYFPVSNNNQNWRDTTYWRDLYWKRLGCRYITIPFNCKQFPAPPQPDPYNPSYAQWVYYDYCSHIKVTELKDSSAYNPNWPWWKRDRYLRSTNLIMPKDSLLTLKMLPGEGRILKVDFIVNRVYNNKFSPINVRVNAPSAYKSVSYGIFKPDTTNYDQNLLNKTALPMLRTNQNNLIVYKDPTDTNAVRYYTTYCLKSPGDSLFRIYYKRSIKYNDSLINAHTDTLDNITWEKEICVSNNISYFGSDNNKNCMYPSIVVRDSAIAITSPPGFIDETTRVTSVQKVFIVFSREGSLTAVNNTECSSCKQNTICQTILRYRNNMLDTNTIKKSFVSKFWGNDQFEYGTPVINASKNINIVAWADSLNGITFAEMNPLDVTGAQPTNHAHVYLNNKRLAKHPAVNAYSTSTNDNAYNADNCTLVWQEDINNNGINQILHARVGRANYGVGEQWIPFNVNNPLSGVTNPTNVNYNTTKYIATLSYNNAGNHTMPVVVSSKAVPNYNAGVWPQNGFFVKERIAWTNLNNNTNQVNTTTIRYRDSDYNTHLCYFGVAFNTVDAVSSVSGTMKPSLVEGCVGNYTGDSIVMSFHTQTDSIAYLLGANYSSTINNTNPHLIQTIKAFNTHLSQHKEEFTNRYWRNQLIAEAPVIYGNYDNQPNARPTITSESKPVCFVGYKDSTGRHSINKPIVNGNPVDLRLPYGYVTDTILGNYYTRFNSDTLFSDWFEIGSSSEINFNFIGLDTSKINVILQKNVDNYMVNLPVNPSSGNMSGYNEAFTFLNGQFYKYRLAFIRMDSTMQYSEDLFLEEIPVENAPLERSANSHIINLNPSNSEAVSGVSISVYPNPAEDIIYATAYGEFGNSTLTVKVYSQLGFELFSTTATSGQVIPINTSKLAIGSYVIKVEEESTSNRAKAAIQTFLIYR